MTPPRSDTASSKPPRKKAKKKGKARKPTLAERADKYDLYQRSVQEPSAEVEFFDRVYKARNGRQPKILREDFCGTYAVSCEWAKKRGRQAIGVDLDPEPLAWGTAHNLSKLKPEAQRRVTILEDDVRRVGEVKADVLAAQNFSFWIFRTRAEVLEYFRVARKNLAPGGVMVLDMMGGSECWEEDREEPRKYKGFRYVWDLERLDPVSHDCHYAIHFRFKDGSSLESAFEYHWRFWTMPEVRELLAEAGFRSSTVYWEGEDEDGEGSGDYDPVEAAESDPSWVAYVVARA